MTVTYDQMILALDTTGLSFSVDDKGIVEVESIHLHHRADDVVEALDTMTGKWHRLDTVERLLNLLSNL